MSRGEYRATRSALDYLARVAGSLGHGRERQNLKKQEAKARSRWLSSVSSRVRDFETLFLHSTYKLVRVGVRE
jgi:hypothetical protein